MVHSACLVTPGSENRANDHEGSPGTWETLPSPLTSRPEIPAYQLQDDPRLRVRADGDEQRRTVVSPSEGNEVRRDGRQGVAVPHSSDEAGERALPDPVERGGAALWRGVGTTPRTSSLEGVSPRGRLAV